MRASGRRIKLSRSHSRVKLLMMFLFCVIGYCIWVSACFYRLFNLGDRAGNQYFQEFSPGCASWFLFVWVCWFIWFLIWVFGWKIAHSRNRPGWICWLCFYSALFVFVHGGFCVCVSVFYLGGRAGNQYLQEISPRCTFWFCFVSMLGFVWFLIQVFG